MFHRTDFGGFLVCCYKAIQQLNGAEKNFVAISLMLNHNLTGLFQSTVEMRLPLWPKKVYKQTKAGNLKQYG